MTTTETLEATGSELHFQFATYLRPAHDIRARLQTKLDIANCTDCPASTLTHCPATAPMHTAPPYVVVAPSPHLHPETHRLACALLPAYAEGQVPVLGWSSCDDTAHVQMPMERVRACAHRFWQQMRALQYPPMLLIESHEAWRSDLAPMTVCGWSFVWGQQVESHVDDMDGVSVVMPPEGVWCMPVGNVRAVGQGAGSMERLKHNVEKFLWCVETEPNTPGYGLIDFAGEHGVSIGEEVGFARWLRPKCVTCGTGSGLFFDCDAVPYCVEHVDVGGMEWKRQRARWLT